MNLQEKTYWSMEKDCLSYYKKHEGVLAGVPIIKTLFGELHENEGELAEAAEAQDQNDPSSYVSEKNVRFDELLNGCCRVSRKLSLYAKSTNNNVLLNEIDLRMSDFTRAGEDNAMLLCARVLNRGKEYAGQASAMGITINEVDTLLAELEVVKGLPSTVEVVNNERKTATQSIKKVLNDSREILDKLDDAFEGIVEDQAIVEGWFSIRKIKGRNRPNNKSTDSSNTPSA